MNPILDCLVSYFGLDEDEQAGFKRYFCYHVVAGPGPTTEAGVASITTLALHDESQRCTYCQNFRTVKTGGPAAALADAIHYLDAFHQHDHLRKVQSDVRGVVRDEAADAVPPGTLFPESQGRGIPAQKA